jgi:adenosylcobyric acid synthase
MQQSMRAIALLGTSSNAGKSWLTTALGAWLRRQGVKVAPFKAQNMSNNSYVTLEGGEMGRAQAAQAEACGLRPVAEMNPILLKPAGNSISQLILLGQPGAHLPARDYYQHIDRLWITVRETLDGWRDRCDVLLLEGAGSPVELNLLHRDLVNLRPVDYLDGRWLLVGDIERGGIFAQMAGTVGLMPAAARSRGLGLVVNKFRGDLSLFADADRYFRDCVPTVPYLGTLPYRDDLQPESEDSLCREAEESGSGAAIAWIRFPYLSNSTDSQPWQLDRGVKITWVSTPAALAAARAIVLPGSKNTLHDLRWLRETGLATAIAQAAARGVPVVGICGGYQMLGRSLHDPTGTGGEAGSAEGLGLLPITTEFAATKTVRQVRARWPGAIAQPHDPALAAPWTAYEIHQGQTITAPADHPVVPLAWIETPTGDRPEGLRHGAVWGTYLHGLFESTAARAALATQAGIIDYQPGALTWEAQRRSRYDAMADLLDTYLDLDPVRRYLDLGQG